MKEVTQTRARSERDPGHVGVGREPRSAEPGDRVELPDWPSYAPPTQTAPPPSAIGKTQLPA